MHGRTHTRRRSARAAALLASAAGHVALGVLVIPRIQAPIVSPQERAPLEIVVVPRERVFPASPVADEPVTPARGSSALPAARRTEPFDASTATPSESPAVEPAAPTGTPGEMRDGLAGVLAERREEAIRQATSRDGERLVPWRGITGTPGGPRSPTDSIDGIPRLGSGEPGDPRIPGSGNVNITAVVERDGVVAQAQERARQGQVHPFLGAVKERVETCWLPVAADADSVTRFIAMEDGVCAKGYHKRRNVGRVFAIYDPAGTRIAIEVDTGSEGSAAVLLRRIQDRVARAFDEAGMREVPPELLDENGLLRVAWNVYIDDFRECDLQGTGANAHKPGGDEIIGIVELDGLY